MSVHFFGTKFWLLLLALTGGAFLGLPEAQAQLGSSQEYGVGIGQQTGAHNWSVFFMVGLIVGMIGGIFLTFFCLAKRERQTINENREFEALMEALVEAEDDLESRPMNPFSGNSRQKPHTESDYTEPVDPWEKPTDWWKGSEEER